MPSETFSVATIRSEQPAITALPAKQRPATTAIRGTMPRQPRPQRERARVEGRHHGVVRVAGPPAAALGEEHGRQPHALDQLEQPVLLAMAEHALRAGQHRVVVRQHRARAAIAEQIAVDASGPGDEAVGGRALDQLAQLSSAALGGDREPPVLDEAPGVDEVGDVLARRPGSGRVAALDRLRSRLVTRRRPPCEHLGQVVTGHVPSVAQAGGLRRAPQVCARTQVPS